MKYAGTRVQKTPELRLENTWTDSLEAVGKRPFFSFQNICYKKPTCDT